jgi:uncharacterized protein
VLARLSPPPAVLVSASAVGWYGDTGEQQVDESGPPGTSFLAGVCRDWEAAAEPAGAGIRVVHPRSGLVLSSRGGLLHQLLPAARLGVLPRFGPGTQVELDLAVRRGRRDPVPARPRRPLRPGET